MPPCTLEVSPSQPKTVDSRRPAGGSPCAVLTVGNALRDETPEGEGGGCDDFDGVHLGD